MITNTYKIINTVLVFIIAILYGEIYLLSEKLSEMLKMIQILENKVSQMEYLQKKSFAV